LINFSKSHFQHYQVAYMAQLDAWNTEWKRQEEEFVITDNKFPPSQVKLIDSLKIEKDSTPVSPYRTLPPISPGIYKERMRGLRTSGRRNRKESIWYKPLPPKPDQLPLTITARVLKLHIIISTKVLIFHQNLDFLITKTRFLTKF